jgi:hypothetical protein
MSATAPPVENGSRITLWRHWDFLKIWAAQSVALFGSEITT